MPGPGPEAEVRGPCPRLAVEQHPLGGCGQTPSHLWPLYPSPPLPPPRPPVVAAQARNLGSIFLVLLLPPAGRSTNTEHFGKSGQLQAV